MGILGIMTVQFNTDISKLTAGIAQAKSNVSGFGDVAKTALGVVAGVTTAAAGAAIGFGAVSVKAAADFQQSMLKVQAYAGLSKQQMDLMNQSILDMSTKVGQSPKVLADAIYPIVSSGYQASDALNILKLSAETAAASGAKTSVVADALTTSLGAMHAPASQAGQYMDMFNKIVSLGKGEVPQYAATIGKLSLAAGGAGVDFGTMGAALATLTTHGFPSVAQASTALGGLFTQVGVKTDALAQHAQKAGIAFDAHKFATLDLSDKLNYLQQITGGNSGELLKLLGGSNLALKAFKALEGGSESLTSNLNAMKNSAGATDSAFKTASSGLNATMARAQAAVETLQVKLGTALLPALTALVNNVAPAISSFLDWADKNHIVEKAIGGVTTAVGIIGTAINTAIGIFNNIKTAVADVVTWFNTWKPQIMSVAGAITLFFLPALIQIAAQAIASGTQIAIQFVASMAKAGIQAVISGAQVTGSFVASMIQAGMEGWASVGKLGSFILSMIQTGAQAVISGAQVVGSFIMSMISAGAQAAISGAKIVGSFILSMITTGTQAVISGAQVVGSFIVSLVSAGIEAITSGAIIMASVVPALIATAVAALATAAPFILIGLVIAAVVIGIVLAIQHWSQIVTWFQGVWTVTWNAVSTFFTNLWNGIISFLGAAWNVIVNIAKAAGLLLLAVIIGPIGLLVLFIIQHWAQIQQVTSNLINVVVGFFQALPGKVMSFLSGLPGMIINLWNTIITDATNAGANIVNGIANGIRNAIGAVGSAISAVTDFISAHLPHSPAKIGALRDLQLQGSLIPEQISVGILSNMSKLDSTMNKLPYPGSSSTTNSSAAVLAAIAAGNNNNGNNNQPIALYIDGKEVTTRLGPHIASAIRVQQGKRGR